MKISLFSTPVALLTYALIAAEGQGLNLRHGAKESASKQGKPESLSESHADCELESLACSKSRLDSSLASENAAGIDDLMDLYAQLDSEVNEPAAGIDDLMNLYI